MTYTPEMIELIKVVEATRLQRVGQRFPSMTMEERDQVLNSFHPDYIKAYEMYLNNPQDEQLRQKLHIEYPLH